MEIIVFDLLGFTAHFRKHFSTTSSLSYTFPPRTTLCGLIAGILGYDRDTYYKYFSSEKCKIGLQIKKPIRRFVQTLNYLMTDEDAISYFKRTFHWKIEPAQIRKELIIADEKVLSEIEYRVFFHHNEPDLMRNLEERLRMRKFFYPPSLGTADNLATLNYIETVKAEVFYTDGEVQIVTVVPVSTIRSILPEKGSKIYIEELVPAEFTEDRILKRQENYVYEGAGKPLKIRIEREVFRCMVKGEEVFGTFM